MEKKIEKTYNKHHYNLMANDLETLQGFISSIYLIQEEKEYLSSLEKDSSSNLDVLLGKLSILFNPHKRDSCLIYKENLHLSNLSEKPLLYNYSLNKVIFLVLWNSDFEDFAEIQKVANDLTSKFKSDEFIVFNTLSIFAYAIIKKLKIQGEFIKIRNVFQSLMKFYTYNSNKRIDTELINLFSSIVKMCSPNEFAKIFTNDEGNLVIFDYDSIFALNCVKTVFYFADHKIKFYFNKNSYFKIKEIISQVMEDNVTWKKCDKVLEDSYLANLWINENLDYDYYKTYEYRFNNLEEEIEILFKFHETNPSKESLSLLSKFFIEVLPYLKSINPHLLVEFWSKFTEYILLDNSNYNNKLNTILGKIHNNMLNNNIDIIDLIEKVNSKLLVTSHTEAFKFYTSLVRKASLPQLHTFAENSQIFDAAVSMVRSTKCIESKSYICNNVAYLIIQSLNEKVNYSLTEKYSSFLNEDYNLKNLKDVNNYLHVLTTFLNSYELNMKEYMKFMILKFKHINSVLFKNKGNESLIIRKCISNFYTSYSVTYPYMKKILCSNSQQVIEDLSRSQCYFL